MQVISLNRALKENQPRCGSRHNIVVLLYDKARSHVTQLVKNIWKRWVEKCCPAALFPRDWFFVLPFNPVHSISSYLRIVDFLGKYRKIVNPPTTWKMGRNCRLQFGILRIESLCSSFIVLNIGKQWCSLGGIFNLALITELTNLRKILRSEMGLSLFRSSKFLSFLAAAQRKLIKRL